MVTNRQKSALSKKKDPHFDEHSNEELPMETMRFRRIKRYARRFEKQRINDEMSTKSSDRYERRIRQFEVD